MTSQTPGFPLPGPALPDPASGTPEVNPDAPERHGPLSFDGIRELDSNPPRVWTVFYVTTLLASLWVLVAYPSIPWLSHGGEQGRAGLLGWSARATLRDDAGRATAQEPAIQARFEQASYAEIEADPALRSFGIAAGTAAFGTQCAACHGRDGQGQAGFPSLRDRDWLWGGTPEAIERTVQVGIRWPGNEETRSSQMPAFGQLGILERPQILDMVQYVWSLSGTPHDAAAAARAAPVFAENCVACHGERGEGNQVVGAPNLRDAVWLHGGSRDQVYQTIHAPHSGVMPAFGGRLPADAIRKLVVYVRSFGGGE
ncbi:MAG: cytochrome c oxidase subunit CcoP [Rhodospirillales bacterium]|nr:cytochrome c oxidase subunit CcoP [Rhodospirillales bacterium]